MRSTGTSRRVRSTTILKSVTALAVIGVTTITLFTTPFAVASDEPQVMANPTRSGLQDDHGNAPPASSDHDHSAHQHKTIQSKIQRSRLAISIPDVELLDQAGQSTRLANLIDVSKPVILNFIFTSCTAICPLMSATFTGFQKLIGERESEDVRLISISIDPEYDTPAQLLKYANRNGAMEDWVFLTGDLEDVVMIERAFDVYRGNKMNHEAATFLRTPGENKWLRIDGLASSSQLVDEYHSIKAHMIE